MAALSTMEEYGLGFQTKVISSLLTHKEFLVNIHDVLSDEYFNNQAQKWIIKEIIEYYEKYHCNVSIEILKTELKKIDNEILKIAIKEQLKESYHASEDDLKYVQEEFSNFCKNQQLKKALLNSVDLLKNGDYDSIRHLIDNALKAGQDKNMGHEYNKDIEYRFREDSRMVIPTPWDEINNLLQGGLGTGDFGLIFGNPGGGKSWTLVALGGCAVSLGYNVIHYTLELGEDYVGKRYDSFFTEIDVREISKHRSEVEQTVSELKGNLIIKEFPAYRATPYTIEAHIKKVASSGIKPDLIIIDYVDLLSTKKRTSDRKEEIDDIYISIKGLARELSVPIWSVSQVNRTGAKENVIEGTSAAGSYDKMMVTDVCISLSRKKEDKTDGTGRFHIMKNRYGPDGMTYNMLVNTYIGEFEITGEYIEGEEATYSKSVKEEKETLDKKSLKNKFFELNV